MVKQETYKYLSTTDEDKKWGVYLTVAGFAEIAPGQKYPPKGHPSEYYFSWEYGRVLNEFQINYITSGSGIFETRKGEFQVNPGSFLLIHPGMWHRYKPNNNTGWKDHFIGFNGEYVQQIFNSGFFNTEIPVIHVGYQDKALEPFYRIFDEIKEERPGFQMVCSGLLIHILGQVLSINRNRDFDGKDIEKKIRKARIMIRENLTQKVNVEELAFELNIGDSNFRKMFKKFTGISPAQYHLLLRLQKARELLICTNKTIKEIAIELGFQSIFYFTRVFKQKMGMPPSELRNRQYNHHSDEGSAE